MDHTNKMAPAGASAEARVHDDGDDLKGRHQPTTNGAGAQADSAVKRLLNGGVGLLDAGLQAAKRGWKIFPCGKQKLPLVKWSEVATTDEATITAWAKQWPGALWARALPANILLIDLDCKHGNNGIRE